MPRLQLAHVSRSSEGFRRVQAGRPPEISGQGFCLDDVLGNDKRYIAFDGERTGHFLARTPIRERGRCKTLISLRSCS